ncbi:HD domain-containing phosphohydrolase [Sporomusa malonica]|uniref:PAS domain S-box-containing protein/diguanylate cyclase (GGDEF) domain-containing protein n=1 Tax=Sporomusa malonica TaxID=112901 RepID=A0A1W2E6S4_9FIRM|nr:HD domain-containing phosphohydrolase [Sporomusa malonica]SMD05483.1 PAS domain S-box-containing protein/diguanylate cyclase (GGDEF) domain-containing protein [Sporomusa malonica]
MDKIGQYLRNWIIPDRSIILFCAVLLVFVWSGTLWQIDHDRKATSDMIRQDGDRLTRAFEEHVRRVLKTNEFYLNSMKAEYEQSYTLSPTLERVFQQLRLDPIATAGIVNSAGDLVVSTLGNAAGVNIATVPHFVYHIAADPGEIYLGRPFVGRTSQKVSIHMTRRINNPDGSFAGVAIIAMDPNYFTKFYREMDLSENYTIRLVGLDGIVRASNHVSELDADMTGSDLFLQIKNASAGFYSTRGRIFGKTLEVSYRTMPDYPVIIQVGVSEQALAPFVQRRNVYLAVAGGVSLFILFSAGYIIARARKQRRDETWLRTFVANTPIVFYAIDLGGHFMLSEGLGLKKIGLEAGEAVGHSVFEMYPDFPDILDAFRRAAEGEAVFFEHKVGEVYLNNRLIPVFDDNGRVIAVVGAAVDITERVLAEQRLQESFEKLTATHEELIATEEELRIQYGELDKANQDLVSQNAVLEALREIAAKLMSQTDRDWLLKTVITWATASAGTPHGNIALLNEEEMVMDELDGLGLFEDHAGIKLPLDTGIIGQVYRTGQPVVIRSYNTWTSRLLHPALDEVRCFAQVPLKREDKVIGVIGVAFTSENHHFGEKELELLTRFAELASIAVENVRKMDELLRSKKTAIDIFNAVGDGLLVNDGETGEILAVNYRLQEWFGYSEKEFKEQGITLISTAANKETALQVIRATVKEGPQPLYERETYDREGRRLILEISSTPVEIDGKTRCLASMRDITSRKQMEEGLEYLRQRDAMTGVYNRAYFETDIIRMQAGKYCYVGIFVCDVDGLKLINDTLGHRQGDDLLKQVAGLLAAGIKAPNYVARIGGDEFAVVLFDSTKEQMEELEQYYRLQVEAYNDESPQLPLSLSIGWALGEETVHVESVFKTADNNMYRQKLHQSQSVRGSIVQTLMKALEVRDHITEGHADRLSILMEMMGQHLSLPKGTISDLRLFAKFHDIGKVGIPDSILKKPGKLTEDEMNIMRQHCEIGFRIAKSSPDLEPIADWVLKHQEHWNGKGYPLGISGEEIPIQCRILSIVDAYDAMTSDRPYRKAMSSEDALAEIRRCSGTQFDPVLAEKFINLLSLEIV